MDVTIKESLTGDASVFQKFFLEYEIIVDGIPVTDSDADGTQDESDADDAQDNEIPNSNITAGCKVEQNTLTQLGKELVISLNATQVLPSQSYDLSEILLTIEEAFQTDDPSCGTITFELRSAKRSDLSFLLLDPTQLTLIPSLEDPVGE